MSSFIPSPVDRGLVTACAVGQGVFVGLVWYHFGLWTPWIALLGIPGGLVTGILTRSNGPALQNGLYVAGLGLPIAAVLGVGYGFVLSTTMGLGLDSVLSFGISTYTVAIAAIFGPIHAISGALAADRGNVIRRMAAAATA